MNRRSVLSSLAAATLVGFTSKSLPGQIETNTAKYDAEDTIDPTSKESLPGEVTLNDLLKSASGRQRLARQVTSSFRSRLDEQRVLRNLALPVASQVPEDGILTQYRTDFHFEHIRRGSALPILREAVKEWQSSILRYEEGTIQGTALHPLPLVIWSNDTPLQMRAGFVLIQEYTRV